MVGHELTSLIFLILASLNYILVFSCFGNSDHHEQATVKLATDGIPGFISIDCGATEDYYDEDTGIFYQSDEKFVESGINRQISAAFGGSKVQQQLKNLRSFPNGTKNCYTLKPRQGKNNRYMIRASFNYANYDGKNQAPVFDLYLGVNKWGTVTTSDIRWKEIIHVPSTNNVYVCLVNTGFGVPFISALELRVLNNSIYNIKSGGLETIVRYGGSVNDKTIRYKDDVYDRLWTPIKLPDAGKFPNWYLIQNRSTIHIQSSSDAYHPPVTVLRTAATTYSATTPITFSWSAPRDATSQCFVYLHFAEIEQLKNGQLRELNISLNNKYYILDEPIKLEYLKPLTVGPLDYSPINAARLNFSVYATKESYFPPILNAFEIFVLKSLPDSPTDPKDADTIMDIKQAYKVKRTNWQGDPCVPRNYSWDGLNCSYNDRPRIISLDLASSGLRGLIAPLFSNLNSVEFLDLSNNNLTGPVPDFFAKLPSLKFLNLTGNKLTGPIPQAVMERVNNGSLTLRVEENQNLCWSTAPCHAKKRKSVIPVIASSIVSVAVVLLIVAIAIWWCCRRSRRQFEFKSEGSLKLKNQEFSYFEILSMTANLEIVLGEGGFGKVYLGTLNDGNKVAVKLRSLSSNQNQNQFRMEVQLLTRVHHKNLVPLIGYCNDGTNMALVYEHMANGNLSQLLSKRSQKILNWKDRIHIAIDAAQGLEYLHNGCKPPIIHRDVKTSNILLNDYMQAKLADFGLSRDLNDEFDTHMAITNPDGTFGYIDPEYYASKNFNKKSDVYSFGIVLLEIITGQPAIIKDPELVHISHWVSPMIERRDIRSIVDQRLPGDFDTDSAWKFVNLAMSCVLSTAIQRPDMSGVLVELKECLEMEMASEENARTESNTAGGSNSNEMNRTVNENNKRINRLSNVIEQVARRHSTQSLYRLNNTTSVRLDMHCCNSLRF